MDGGYPYTLAVDPAGKVLFAPQPAGGAIPTPQSGSGDVWVFQIAADGTLSPASGAPFTYQAGGTTNTPFAVAVDPNGGFVYFTDDTANTVTAYSYTAAGALTEVGTPQSTGGKPTGVAIDPTGQFLYVTNSADATVSAFTINATTGALTTVGAAVTTGANASPGSPTAIQVDPSGQFVYVATGDDATIAAFQIDRTTGVLSEVGSVAGDAQSVAGVGNMGAGASALAID
jgi:DNA-binding beta-propeller fold protein YncE